MVKSEVSNEYERVFKLDRDVTLRIKLNQPVRDITLVIGRTVRVDTNGKSIIYETGFLRKKRKRALKKLFRRNLFRIFPFLRKFSNKPQNKTSIKI